MTWVSMPWRGRPSDAAYVERIRRNLEVMRLWRPWLVAMNIGCVAGLVYAFSKAADWLFNNPARVGFGSGLVVGVAVGFITYKMAYLLVTSLWCPRAYRLLVRYHDALEEALRKLAERPPAQRQESA